MLRNTAEERARMRTRTVDLRQKMSFQMKNGMTGYIGTNKVLSLQH